MNGNIPAELKQRAQSAGAVEGQVFQADALGILAEQAGMDSFAVAQDQ